MTPRKTSIGQMLGEYERRHIILPEFQRPYSWEKAQLATFWGDLQAFRNRFEERPVEATYFLGPIVIMETTTTITVLDGQQRLATATILLAALRNLARESHATRPFQELDYLARDIQRELIEKKDTRPLVYSLSLSELDEPFFLQTIKIDSPALAKPSLCSHQLIQRAYEFFCEEIKALTNAKSSMEQLQILCSLKDALTKGMSLVAIVVDDEEAAYDIFETLNDRGLRLSVPDLVVNLLLKRCAGSKARQSVRQTWNSTIQQMGRRDVSRFLRHLWLSKFGDLKAKGLYTEIKEHLTSHSITSIDFAQSCSDACEDYLKLLEVDKSLPKDALGDVEGLVRYLGVQNCLPLLLAAYQCLSQSDFIKLLRTTTSLYVRHTLIGNQNPLELETVFYDAAREIRAQTESKVSSSKSRQAAKAKLMAINPSDALVSEKFDDLMLTKSEATWFMVQLANAKQSKTKEVCMDKANVEHIFPQNAGKEWPHRANLEPLIWHVGNLTILGKRINAKAQNKCFADKCRDHYAVSEIDMTKDLLKESTWDEATIRKRAKALAAVALQIWK
ncbi:MAG: DUF262 domain-containing HNH endonuclease family protein [Kiritimatiellae bacterium]|nr:DUF262 domain-containing HNH endonuclease family protein [Kiritimatiellia bacterium]